MGKIWYHGKKNYGAMKKTMVLYQIRWFIINGKSYHHGKIEFFEQIYCLRTLLYYGKNYGSMGKNYDTMEKLWYYTENYGI